MTGDEFTAEIRKLADLYDADFPDRQTKAWFAELRHLPVEGFREVLLRITRNLEALPFKWNLVAAVEKASVQLPGGKPQSFDPPPQDDVYWKNGLAKIRQIQAKLGWAMGPPGRLPSQIERKDGSG